MIRILFIVVGALVALVLVVVVIGYTLPIKHRASRQAILSGATPDAVYAAIADITRYPSWRSSVRSVSVLPPVAGLAQFTETSSDGVIRYSIEVDVPGVRRVTRIADTSLPFGGSWTFELTPTPDGTVLRITEDGEVYNPLFRFMSRFVFSHHATIERYLRDLSAKFGATPRISE